MSKAPTFAFTNAEQLDEWLSIREERTHDLEISRFTVGDTVICDEQRPHSLQSSVWEAVETSSFIPETYEDLSLDWVCSIVATLNSLTFLATIQVWPSFDNTRGAMDSFDLVHENGTMDAETFRGISPASSDSPMLTGGRDATPSWVNSPLFSCPSPPGSSSISFTSSAINSPSPANISVSPSDIHDCPAVVRAHQSPLAPSKRIEGIATKITSRNSPFSHRSNELAQHNTPVDFGHLEDCLRRIGHVDRIPALHSLSPMIHENVMYHRYYKHDRSAYPLVPAPAIIPSSFFTPFSENQRTRIEGTTRRKVLVYTCLFCGHRIRNHTQAIQHLMGRHFKYFPHQCDDW